MELIVSGLGVVGIVVEIVFSTPWTGLFSFLVRASCVIVEGSQAVGLEITTVTLKGEMIVVKVVVILKGIWVSEDLSTFSAFIVEIDGFWASNILHLILRFYFDFGLLWLGLIDRIRFRKCQLWADRASENAWVQAELCQLLVSGDRHFDSFSTRFTRQDFLQWVLFLIGRVHHDGFGSSFGSGLYRSGH